MGNIITQEPEKIIVNIKKRVYKVIKVNIPYDQLSMIRVLQREFDYEVKGTIYVDHDHKFKSFEVRTDNSEIYSYGASDWRISFHTHPDKTSQKYGIRYFSPPSVDDVLEIYDHNLKFVPDNTHGGFGEISIIFANEGLYVLQVNRSNFQKFNSDGLPIEGLEEILNGTLTEFLVSEIKKGIQQAADENLKPALAPATAPAHHRTKPIIKNKGAPVQAQAQAQAKAQTETKVDFDNPNKHITMQQYITVVKRLSSKVSELYGFDMSFYSWDELERDGLTLQVCDYFLNKKVID